MIDATHEEITGLGTLAEAFWLKREDRGGTKDIIFCWHRNVFCW